jgi:multidrug resistance efflux pump
MPFKGVIQELKIPCGQPVTEGTVLARYKLDKESVVQIRRRLSPSQISELEMRLAEMDRNITALGSKRNELKHLAAEKMAPAQSLAQVEQEIHLLENERASAQARLRQEKGFVEEDTALVRHQLSVPVQASQVPDSGSLVAPVAGHVIWVHPDLKTGAELPAGTPSFVIGVMDPMIMRAKVHEIEAMRLSLGDTAEISIESIPGRKVEGVISKISWSPGTPGLDEPSFYEVELTVANPGFGIRDGLKGEAVMRTGTPRDQK